MHKLIPAILSLTAATALPFAVHGAASTNQTADRIEASRLQATDTVPPPTARSICNSLIWKHMDPSASDTCFRAVTAERGWTTRETERWLPWVVYLPGNLIGGESAYCWNLRNGGQIRPYSNCEITRQGRGSDTGLGQATPVWYNDAGYLCVEHNYCGSNSILRSPYDSMLASVVLLIEIDGSSPWCFPKLYEWHQCWNTPDR